MKPVIIQAVILQIQIVLIPAVILLIPFLIPLIPTTILLIPNWFYTKRFSSICFTFSIDLNGVHV